jgi:uncharacterized protein
MSFRLIAILVILFLLDLYVFQGIKVLMHGRQVLTQRIVSIVYWSVTVLCFSIIISGQFIDWHTWPKTLRVYSFALIIIVYPAKIFVSVFLLLDDVIRLLRVLFVGISGFFSTTDVRADDRFRISRLDFLVKTGFVIAAIPFFSLIYGMLRGAYNYKIRKLSIKFPDLPEAFDGFRIVQISDLHTGSFMGTNHLKDAIDLVLAQNGDVIFFTGDLVNDVHTEALEFRNDLSRLKSPHGIYSILGNHDYGDYYKWPDINAKAENLNQLKNFQKSIGWKLLLNENVYIERNEQKIGLIGVENYSGRGNFSRYGDMKKAVENFTPASFNILLSHDPSHWNAGITDEHKYIDLTLSGHTHGFQFGIEIPGFKWSPVQYVYRQWAGLYKQSQQYLYVNRGLGFIGYPGRVGIMPEITVITLNKG